MREAMRPDLQVIQQQLVTQIAADYVILNALLHRIAAGDSSLRQAYDQLDAAIQGMRRASRSLRGIG